MMRKFGTVAALAAALCVLAAIPAAAGAAPSGKLHMGVQVDRFVQHGKKTTAQGTVTTNLSDVQGHKTTFRSPVTLQVARGASCQILNLELDQLQLSLLGLNVHLDKVILTVTGQAHGGVLGKLFCKLANAKAASAKRAVVASLNKGLRQQTLRPISFTVAVPQRTVSAAQAGSCQVLNLVLGPLNLNLLGLVVDLNQVNLNITAVRGQGTLGDIFCQLADNNASGH